MEGFKANPKMKCDLPCYKEGGFVKRDKAKHSESTEMKKDVAQDKKVVKKAFKIHDEQSHDEKTDLSKLKKGGRAKKEVGTVKKYKKGGSVKKMADGGMSAMAAAPTTPAMAGKKPESKLLNRLKTMPSVQKMKTMPGIIDKLGKLQQAGASGMAGMGAVSNAERAMVNNPGLVEQLGMAGQQGQAQPLGDMPQPPMSGMGSMSDDERMNMMRGLQAVGQYAYGGKVC